MRIEEIIKKDLKNLEDLPPKHWGNIIPKVKVYLENDFCTTLKIVKDSTIIGIGTTMQFEDSAWLAFIIVNEKFRNQGYGFKIVDILVERLKNNGVKSINLIASDLGVPLYKKFGFEIICKYNFFKRDSLYSENNLNLNIINYDSEYYEEIMKIDKEVSGEKRENILGKYVKNSKLYINKGKLLGFYLPDFGEGVIIARDNKVGEELLKLKLGKEKDVCLPEINSSGVNFLLKNGYKKFKTATRMSFGDRIFWNGDTVYSRIGGNLG